MSSQPRLAIAFWLISATLIPATIDRVRQLLTTGRAELRFRGIGGIEMQRMLVHRQQGEPGVVGLADRPPGPVLIDIAEREILEIAAGAGAPAPRRDFPGDCDHAVLPARIWLRLRITTETQTTQRS